MKRAIYIRFLIIISLTALLSGAVSAVFAAAGEERQVCESAAMLCKSLTYQYNEHPNTEYLSKVLSGIRVTLIDSKGVVLEDSDVAAAAMESHANRSEIQNAKEGYIATDSRASDTLGSRFMYAATKMEDGNILRIALPYGGIWNGILDQLPVFLITFSVTALLCIFTSFAFVKKIVRPLDSFTEQLYLGEYDKIPANSGYYEIDRITHKIQDFLLKIHETEEETRLQNEKIQYILSNIEEGFILLDDQKNIVLMNKSAGSILHADPDFSFHNFMELTRQRNFVDAVDRAISENQSTLFDLKTDDAVYYSIHVSPVKGEYVDSSKSGATILLMDVSAQRLSEKQRSEFFTNASHELKTPITTLMGLSEMLENGTVPAERFVPIYSRIHAETVRMRLLIGDILTISRLESGVTDDNMEKINLKEIAAEGIVAVESRAKENNIHLELQGDDAFVMANSRRIWELITNLIDNAVKYNKPGGNVVMKTFTDGADAVFLIRDTGIGIAEEEQSRIFERFFRGGGAGKAVKGTGLGLSIVKHIVKNYGGAISLKSRPDFGTEFRIALPRAE